MSRQQIQSLAATPRAAFACGVLLVLGACGQNGNDQGQGPGMGPGGEFPPAPVTLAEVRSEQVRLEADYAGRLQGSRQAEVRARVGGILEARLYEEGGLVEEGAPLFRIEEAPFRIALQRAEAEQANSRAVLNQAQREWRRVAGLFDQGAVSARERDRALAEREAAEARIALAEAGVAQARLELDYTTARAPVDGVTGLESVTEGNLLASGALLTTVTQLDPVQVRFAMPAEDAMARQLLAENGGEDWLEARLLFPDGTVYPQAGQVDFTASTVDPRTGNVVARAVFPNPDRRLKPGALVRIRLAVERLDGVFRIDAAAVSQGREGPILFVVDNEDTARARPVRLGPVVDGRQIVLEGLEDGDRVVVNGQVALRDGAKVAVEPGAGRSE
jgi:membrane fusion protein (multidrug efflux system)